MERPQNPHNLLCQRPCHASTTSYSFASSNFVIENRHFPISDLKTAFPPSHPKTSSRRGSDTVCSA